MEDGKDDNTSGVFWPEESLLKLPNRQPPHQLGEVYMVEETPL